MGLQEPGSPRLGVPPAVESPSFRSVVPKQGPVLKAPPFLANDIVSISQHLKLLSDHLSGFADSPSPASAPLAFEPVAPKLLSSLSPDEVVCLVHRPGSLPLPVRPCNWSNGSNTKTHWTLEELHRALGCRQSCNYWHIIQTSLDGQWVDGGEFLLLLGSYTTIPKAPRGGSIDREKSFFLDIFHVDIAFGDCVLVGGFHYSLIFTNRATRYNWVLGLKDLSKESILLAFCLFRADAGSYARYFRCDCDLKLFGTAIKEHLVDHNSNIVAAAAGCQSSNGLVESHWKIMVHMAWAYRTEKQMPWSFWFYAVSHSTRMMNAIPGKFVGKLASPLLLVHSVGHDKRTWFPLFLVCYFHCEREGDISWSHCQAHTIDGIAIGRSPTSNAMLVYSPCTKKYYKPDSYRLDLYRLPSLVYPDLRYNGGLFCSLVRDSSTPMEELYPSGTRVERIDPTTKLLIAGTVMDIPISTDELGSPSYLILFDNGTSALIPIQISNTAASPTAHSSLLPPFLSINSRITYEHDGTYHKGFLSCKPCGTYDFSFNTHVKKKSEDWDVDLPNLLFNWADLCTKGILIPGHVVHTFICPAPSSVPLVSASST